MVLKVVGKFKPYVFFTAWAIATVELTANSFLFANRLLGDELPLIERGIKQAKELQQVALHL